MIQFYSLPAEPAAGPVAGVALNESVAEMVVVGPFSQFPQPDRRCRIDWRTRAIVANGTA
jgi:hypothetical protein